MIINIQNLKFKRGLTKNPDHQIAQNSEPKSPKQNKHQNHQMIEILGMLEKGWERKKEEKD